jgi:hypothetical protein
MAFRISTQRYGVKKLFASYYSYFGEDFQNFSATMSELPINDEPVEGFVFFVTSTNVLFEHFEEIATKYFFNPRGNYLFIVLCDNLRIIENIEEIMKEIWLQYKIVDVIFLLVNLNSGSDVSY